MKNYFDNTKATELWYRAYRHGEDGAKEELFTMAGDVIKAIIYTHRFQRFENFDECYSVAAEALVKALPKFDPEYITKKGTTVLIFNYISLVAKNSIKYFTIHNSKNRNNVDITAVCSERTSVPSPEQDYIYSWEATIKRLRQQIEAEIPSIKTERTKAVQYRILEAWEEYTSLNRNNITKRGFFKYVKKNYPPINANNLRYFLKILKKVEKDYNKGER